MEREDVLKFTNSVILLSKLFARIEDKFLKQKLHGKISDFVFVFIEQKNIHSSTSHKSGFRNAESVAKSDEIVQREHVAQSRHKDLINAINNLIDYLEHLAHISKNNTTPLFLAQRNLLKFKLHILKKNKVCKSAKGVTAEITTSKLSVKPGSVRLALKSNSSKERIFSFIKKTPDVRTKEVMSEFSALSSRTVKRNLKELTDEGLLKKRSDGVAVYYLAADLN